MGIVTAVDHTNVPDKLFLALLSALLLVAAQGPQAHGSTRPLNGGVVKLIEATALQP